MCEREREKDGVRRQEKQSERWRPGLRVIINVIVVFVIVVSVLSRDRVSLATTSVFPCLSSILA